MLYLFIDETGSYYKMSPKGPWIPMEDKTKEDSMLEKLQQQWKKHVGLSIPTDQILTMLEDAESISVSYPIPDGILKEEVD